jgi:hypothetical protein
VFVLGLRQILRAGAISGSVYGDHIPVFGLYSELESFTTGSNEAQRKRLVTAGNEGLDAWHVVEYSAIVSRLRPTVF